MTKRPNALELRHPIFLPIWRRLALVAALALWAVVEVIAGNPYWAALMAGIGIYAIYVFFFDFTLDATDKVSDDASQ